MLSNASYLPNVQSTSLPTWKIGQLADALNERVKEARHQAPSENGPGDAAPVAHLHAIKTGYL